MHHIVVGQTQDNVDHGACLRFKIGWVVARKMLFLCSDGLVTMVVLYFLMDMNGNSASHVEHLELTAMSWHAGKMYRCCDITEEHLTALLWSQSQIQWHIVGVLFQLDNWHR